MNIFKGVELNLISRAIQNEINSDTKLLCKLKNFDDVGEVVDKILYLSDALNKIRGMKGSEYDA